MTTFKAILVASLLVLTSCNTAQNKPSSEKSGDGLFAKIKTSKGDILLQLEFEKTPVAVANFVSLAEGKNSLADEKFKKKPFYDGLKFHRVIKNFMIQGGDPNGDGSGNSGYKFGDEFPKDSIGNLLFKHDKKGVLSMANSGKATNGSQFFITHKATPWLDGKHTVFGHVVAGEEVLDAIEQGDVIEKVSIIRKGKRAKRFKARRVFENGVKQMRQEVEAKEAKNKKLKEETIAKFNTLKKKATIFPTGLLLYIDNANAGEQPKKGQFVKVAYAGFLADGTLFDTSMKDVAIKHNTFDFRKDDGGRYKPFKTVYSNKAQLIPGFKEGIQHLKVGDKAVLFIPSELGYGSQGIRGVIPPNSDLIFIVEITAIVK